MQGTRIDQLANLEDHPKRWYHALHTEDVEHKTSWKFPSGLIGEVTIRTSRHRGQRVTFTWYGPPTEPDDLDVFLEEVLPEVLTRAEKALHPLDVTDQAFVGSATFVS